MKRLKFEETPCIKLNCIHVNKEDRICNLDGMNLDENLSLNFKCGNMNDPNAQKIYFPKPENINLKFKLISKEDKNFQILLKTLKDFIEFIRNNINDSNIERYLFERENIPIDHEFIIEPNFFQKLIGKNDEFNRLKNNLIETLSILLPYSNDNIEFYIYPESRAYFISIGDIFDNFLDTTIIFYIKNPQEFEDKILNCINNWREIFLTKILTCEIILPLKGLYFAKIFGLDTQNNGKRIILPTLMTGGIISGFPNIQNIKIQYKLDNYKIKVHQKEISSDILLKPSPSFTILRHNTKPLDSKIYSYYITSNLFFPLSFRKHLKPQKIIESIFWKKIREIYQTFLICGIKIQFGKPFYRFPWLISKNLIDQISFALPDWIDISSMWLRPIESFVPDFFIDNLGFNINLETSISHSGDVFFDKAKILKKSVRILTSPDLTYPFSKLQEIKNIYSKLTSYEKSINNFKNENIIFLLNNLQRLAQRKSIKDVILDTCVILESIGSSQKSKKYLILSSIMANPGENFKEFFKKEYVFLDLLDDLRNNIIHGSANKWKKRYIEFTKNLLNNEELSDQEIFNSQFTQVHNKIFEKVSNIIKRIIVNDIDITKLSEKYNFIDLIP